MKGSFRPVFWALFFIGSLAFISYSYQEQMNPTPQSIEISAAQIIDPETKYASILKQSPVYDPETGEKIGTTKSIIERTFHIQEVRSLNEKHYYLLADNSQKVLGYVSEQALSLETSPAGAFHKREKYIETPTQSFHWLRDFTGDSTLSQKEQRQRVYRSSGYYRHLNGQVYLSLYDNKKQWLGYLNEASTTPAVAAAEKIRTVQDYLDKTITSDDFGIYVLSLADGSVAEKNGDQVFQAASTGKLPILYYTQKMIDEGQIDPDQEFEYIDAINEMPIFSYMPDGAGVLQNHDFGEKFSVQTILHWTVYYSDNQGANFLGYYVANQYDQTMQDEISQILGRTWDDRDSITARENALLMQAIYEQNGELIDELSDTEFDDQRIAKYIPVQVAHKIGDVYDLKHDVAIVYTDQPFVLSVMTKGDLEYEEISVLAKEIYELLK